MSDKVRKAIAKRQEQQAALRQPAEPQKAAEPKKAEPKESGGAEG